MNHDRATVKLRWLRRFPFRSLFWRYLRYVNDQARPFIRDFELAQFRDISQKKRLRRAVRSHEHRWAIGNTLYYAYSLFLGVLGMIPGFFLPTVTRGIVTVAAYAVLWLTMFTMMVLFYRIWTFLNPEAFVVNYLLLAFCASQRQDQWVTLKGRREIVRYLETAASATETYLPRRLRAGDPTTHQWWVERSAQIARAIRELKRWVLTPGAHTRAELGERLLHYIESLMFGNWDALPRAEVTTSPARTWLAQCRDFVYAVIITAAIWGLYNFDSGLPASLLAPLTTLMIFLALVKLLSAVDPSNSVLVDFKAMLALFRGGGAK